MNYDEARHLLLMHGSGMTDAQGNPLVYDKGFLGMLRPYRGTLITENFHIVMEALYVVGEQIHESEKVDRQLVESIWSMCLLARLWGIEPDGMLQRNHLITPADTKQLAIWIETIERSALAILGGCPADVAISGYAEYIQHYPHGENIAYFIPLMQRYLDDCDGSDPAPIPEALGRLGPMAASALPSLRAAARKRYGQYCHEETIQSIVEAIRRIEGGA